jgi:hypothetical protein
MTRFLGISGALVVLMLVGAAMFHRNAASKVAAGPITIEPGQPAPHEDRGICTTCHLIGGPATKPMVRVGQNNPSLAQNTAPPIRIDQVRPHAERGSCVNCHTILSATQVTAAGDQLALLNGAPIMNPLNPAFAQAMPMQAMYAAPMPAAFNPYAAAPVAFVPGNGFAAQNGFVGGVAAADLANPALGNTAPAAQQIGGMVGPPILAGATPPHGQRGTCTACHTILQPMASPPMGAAPAMQPAAPAWMQNTMQNTVQAQQAPQNGNGLLPQGPRETEAFGMGLWPTTGDTLGMLVVDVEGMARRAGLKLGDIVRAVDGQVTTDVPSFKAAIRNADPTRGVVLDVLRDGQPMALVLK